ncbi:MAG: FAD-dependent oxidoreductase, partial [Acidobacteriota bacterium]
AAAPPLEGLEQAGYLTNETLFSLTHLPRRLGVIGAGPIGCEMAQAMARFGSEVTLIEAMHGVLPREDPEASAVIKLALLDDGIRVMCCGKQLKVGRSQGGKTLSVDSHDSHYEIEVDEILVAVGRAANVEGMGLAAAGVAVERSGVTVNDRLQTTNPRIYAAGDVCSRYKFTHAADAMARIVIQNALFSFLPVKAKASALTMPWCTYTSPELAHVGPLLQEMEAKGVAYDTVTVRMEDVDRAILEGEMSGLVKIHVARGTDRILAATVVSSHAGDLISEITLGMVHKIGLKGYSSTIHPYPTQAEVLRKAGDAFKRRQLTPRTRRILAKLMAWQR